jgi:hypothetical protein
MPYYKEKTLFKTKNNRLHIFKRKDTKTNNWYGRTFIEGKQTQTSSSTSNKNKAKRNAAVTVPAAQAIPTISLSELEKALQGQS